MRSVKVWNINVGLKIFQRRTIHLFTIRLKRRPSGTAAENKGNTRLPLFVSLTGIRHITVHLKLSKSLEIVKTDVTMMEAGVFGVSAVIRELRRTIHLK